MTRSSNWSYGQASNRPLSTKVRLVVTVVASLLLAGSIAAISSGTDKAGATTVPIRAAFYYPWFPETWHSTDHYTPSLGHYSSIDATVLDTHVAEAKYARLDAFISSYWGQGTSTAGRLPLLLNAARAQGFHVAPYYEPESNAKPPTATQLASDFTDLYKEAQGDTAWLNVNSRPALFIYNTGNEASCAGLDRIKTASAGRFYLDVKVFPNYQTCAGQPDSWHQYGPAVGYDQQGSFSATVSPGFYKYSESRPRMARGVAAFQSNLAKQTASGAQWQLMTTFNEWGEGTSVEPATRWASASGNGQYLDAMRAAYGATISPSSSPTTTRPSGTPTTSTTSRPASSSASPGRLQRDLWAVR